jgi:hypothetical protein
VSTIGSILLRSDPVKAWEHYARTLVPVGSVGPAELYFDDYKPNLQAQGWFHGASVKVFGRENLLKELYANALGRMMEAWGYGIKQYFEGRVVEVVFNLPPDRFTKTLDQVANNTWMRADYDGDGNVDRTTVLENAASKAKYGIVDTILAGGEVEGLTVGNQAVQSFLDLRAFPKPGADLGGGSGRPYIELFCRGYIHTLSNQVYNQTADTGTQSMTAEIRDIVGNPAVDADSLLTDLMAWWDMEDAAGESRLDAHGANDLADAASTAQAAGIRGNGADFELSDVDYLTINDNADLSVANVDFSIAMWVKAESIPAANMALVVKGSGGVASATLNPYVIYVAATTGQVKFAVSNGVAQTTVGTTAIVAGGWYFIRAWHDAAGDTINLKVGGYAAQSAAHTTGAFDDAATFRVGASGTAATPFDGIVDSLAFWKRLLTDAEAQRLYRDGMGMSYSMIQQAVAAAGKGEFFASTGLAPNTTSVTKELDSDRKGRDLVDDMAALGDADGNRYLVQGRGRTATSVKGRRFVFKQAAPVVTPPTI